MLRKLIFWSHLQSVISHMSSALPICGVHRIKPDKTILRNISRWEICGSILELCRNELFFRHFNIIIFVTLIISFKFCYSKELIKINVLYIIYILLLGDFLLLCNRFFINSKFFRDQFYFRIVLIDIQTFLVNILKGRRIKFLDKILK